MDKRYQVFISSTFTDLADERRRVIQTIIEMDCIPAGMELFPATDEEQFEFIKRVIDDCDYYQNADLTIIEEWNRTLPVHDGKAFFAAITRSGVNGKVRSRSAVASKIALPIAAGVTVIDSSPAPNAGVPSLATMRVSTGGIS